MSDNKIRMAIVFTCHNREEKTRNCIETLRSQRSSYSIQTEYYICDDGSTDNTCKTVMGLLPEASLILGNGDLFWARGMHAAMLEAVKTQHDFYLMVNDDVAFDEIALDTMLRSYYTAVKDTNGKPCGIVGATLKTDRSEISYGGWRYVRKLKIGRAELLEPNGVPRLCDLANWNCFLLPDEVIQSVGLIDPYYHHSKGDFDYSMMMKRKGYPIYIATDFIGTVDNNESSWGKEKSISLKLRKLFSVKGIPPKYEMYYFTKNWGLLGFCFFFYSFPKTVIHAIME